MMGASNGKQSDSPTNSIQGNLNKSMTAIQTDNKRQDNCRDNVFLFIDNISATYSL